MISRSSFTSLNWPLFVLVWLCSGFATGTYLLLVPLRAILTFLRENNYSNLVETAVVGACIVLLVLVTFGASVYLVKLFSRSASPIRYVAVLLPVALAGYSLYLFLNPANIDSRSGTTDEVTKSFFIGAYPEQEKLAQLKAEGYTAVISLLHPLVVPFEPVLLEKERKAAAAVGLELIEAPMLPWVGNNEASIKKLKALTANPAGKYYVHCYLGKDRVNVVKKILSGSSLSVESETPGSARKLTEVKAFERGPIIQISPDIFFTPLPTDDEYFGYLVAGDIKTIVSLLDAQVPDNKPLMQKEASVAAQYQLSLRNLPIQESSTQAELLQVAKEVVKLPKPLVVHHFSTNYELSKRFEQVLRKVAQKQ
ncbi:hypothetical protein [Sabulibacter ruber]|uniref:hypothetical protein n=1 Tax=Sabulibacter ruber TaxID=2811901 RepID=UPI001A95BED6|nr:hypothetical protein [Sabulibacter ruber]